ncbi:MAG: HAMP domain-containing histidine kinase [Flavobacteriales bacterium]|nr:HAMP domain-containing histidine kinase [Flavobacteriales bacterium]
MSSEVLGDPAIVSEPERLRTYAGIIRSENERLRAQVERVLQLTTLEDGNARMKRDRVDMHTLIGEVSRSFDLVLKERDGELRSDLQASETVVSGDRVHLSNALHNLVDNAVKYSPAAPTIELGTKNDGRWLHIQVRDHGIGIGRQDQRHIFERFYRVHTGNVHDVKGFGLGLHYVRRIAEAHGGQIAVHSEPGHGSTFILELPLA